MKTHAYLVLFRGGVVRLVKNPPRLKAGQVAVRLNIEVPDQFFNACIPEVNILIPEAALIRPDIDVWLDEEE